MVIMLLAGALVCFVFGAASAADFGPPDWAGPPTLGDRIYRILAIVLIAAGVALTIAAGAVAFVDWRNG